MLEEFSLPLTYFQQHNFLKFEVLSSKYEGGADKPLAL
jgi:hypothetical protein